MHFICDFTQKAVEEVFDTMLSLKVESLHVYAGAEMPSERLSGIVGSVSFAGKINGVVYMHYSSVLACDITEKMLGARPASIAESDVADVIGELTNMVSGVIKRHSGLRGYDGWLSIPMILRGESILVEGKGAPLAFHCQFRIPDFNRELGVRVYVKLES